MGHAPRTQEDATIELLHTAIARGKRVVVGSRQAIEIAVRNADTARRYSHLTERLKAQMGEGSGE